MDSPRITYTPRPDATPETEVTALAAIYKFVLFDSQTRRGDLLHDLTDTSPKKQTTRQEKKGNENADVYGH